MDAGQGLASTGEDHEAIVRPRPLAGMGEFADCRAKDRCLVLPANHVGLLVLRVVRIG
ncbi:hypothetical protein D3C81_1731220 [compost metagenome]